MFLQFGRGLSSGKQSGLVEKTTHTKSLTESILGFKLITIESRKTGGREEEEDHFKTQELNRFSISDNVDGTETHSKLPAVNIRRYRL